jgi:hypothetical protein
MPQSSGREYETDNSVFRLRFHSSLIFAAPDLAYCLIFSYLEQLYQYSVYVYSVSVVKVQQGITTVEFSEKQFIFPLLEEIHQCCEAV